jgi:glutathione S-transferase
MTAKQSQLEVFWVSGSPFAWRVLLTLEVKRLSYASRLLEASKGDLKKPEYLKLNPRGKVPTLKDGDFVLGESLAIMAYLDRKHPAPPLFGANAQETARIWQLISEYFSYLDGPANRIIAPVYFGKVSEKREDIRAAVPVTHNELERFEGEIGSSPWFGGEAICAADIAIYPFLKSLLRAASKEAAAPLDLGLLPFNARYPRLAAWMQHVERIPGYEKTYPPHWR